MARIRSIKPDFWRDGKVARLTPACALFFIGLWTFCDDEGKCKTDSYELSLNLPSFRSQDIVKHISRLAESGLVRLSRNRDWLLVENWNHQKIDKPKQPKISKSEIEWDQIVTEQHSTNILRTVDDESPIIRRKDRIGKDRKGSDSIPVGNESEKAVAETASPPAKVGHDLVACYCEIWKAKYHANPVIRPQDAKALKVVAESVGIEKAKDLVRGYMRMNSSWFITKSHDIQTFAANLASVQKYVATGEVTTRQDAIFAETGDALSNQLRRLGAAI